MPVMGGSSVTRFRRVDGSDASSFRELRLRALQSDPQAFGSTYEREAQMPHSRWQTWVDRSSAGDAALIALAEANGVVIGMAGGYQPDGKPHERVVWGMWVDPEWRGAGVGYGLVGAVEDWAIQAGALRLVLWVVETNHGAVDLYRKAGFIATGETQALPSDEFLEEVLLSKPIGSTQSDKRT